MKNYSSGNMLSAYQQCQIDKEKAKKQAESINEEVGSIGADHKECGIKNPCVFGKHNKNFKKSKKWHV